MSIRVEAVRLALVACNDARTTLQDSPEIWASLESRAARVLEGVTAAIAELSEFLSDSPRWGQEPGRPAEWRDLDDDEVESKPSHILYWTDDPNMVDELERLNEALRKVTNARAVLYALQLEQTEREELRTLLSTAGSDVKIDEQVTRHVRLNRAREERRTRLISLLSETVRLLRTSLDDSVT